MLQQAWERHCPLHSSGSDAMENATEAHRPLHITSCCAYITAEIRLQKRALSPQITSLIQYLKQLSWKSNVPCHQAGHSTPLDTSAVNRMPMVFSSPGSKEEVKEW